MTTQEYIKHFKKEIPLFGVLVGLGCPAALAKKANKEIMPVIDKVLND